MFYLRLVLPVVVEWNMNQIWSDNWPKEDLLKKTPVWFESPDGESKCDLVHIATHW